MSPVVLILGLIMCVLAMIALALIGLDNWVRGNTAFAVAMFLLAIMALGLASSTVDWIEAAYVERINEHS